MSREKCFANPLTFHPSKPFIDMKSQEECYQDDLMDCLLKEQARKDREQVICEIEHAIMSQTLAQAREHPTVDWKRLILSGAVAAAVVLGFGYILGASLHPKLEGPHTNTGEDSEKLIPMWVTYRVEYVGMDKELETKLPREIAYKRPIAPVLLNKKEDRQNTSFPEMAISAFSPYDDDPSRFSTAETEQPRPVLVTQFPGKLVDQNWRTPLTQPLSSFSLDSENASYANIRHVICEGLPVSENLVLIEECINAFSYDYPAPRGDQDFTLNANILTCPWNDRHMLIKIGIQGRAMSASDNSNVSSLIAKDAAIQIEFNPQRVESYRLIGYALCLSDEERTAAGGSSCLDIHAGHQVTAIYEVIPLRPVFAAPKPGQRLKYQAAAPSPHSASRVQEWLTLKLNYQDPENGESRLQQAALKGEAIMWHHADVDSRFASTVALFGMKLRGMDGLEGITWDHVLAMAQYDTTISPHQDRGEFISLVKALKSRQR